VSGVRINQGTGDYQTHEWVVDMMWHGVGWLAEKDIKMRLVTGRIESPVKPFQPTPH
jgi:hypothetical protein